ncbi:MAG TPA: hypothetical protein VFX97_03165 [Pyrinomonadaceae bacterium]|nr:hypothetical protein [Pyrinomonadaceae bacterium]
MSRARLTHIVLLALLLITGRAHAQEPENRRTADLELQRKAIDLLKTVGDQIGTLQSVENRARLGANVAASLWKHDEQRARRLLDSVQSDINLGLQAVDGDEDQQTAVQTRMVFLKLRTDTVERIAKHDADLALAFLKGTEPAPSNSKSHELAELERNLEIRLASQIAAENPEMALKLGRKSLSRGFSHDLLSLLRKLQRKDRETALTLYKEIVSKLTSVGLGRFSPAFYFAQSLARSFKPPVVDDATFRELIKLFITTAFEHRCDKAGQGSDESFCAYLGSFLPEMEKIDPSRAAELKQWAPEAPESQRDPEAYEQVQETIQNGTVDELLAVARKHPQMAEWIYWHAISKAESLGDIDRARKIATDYITDSESRKRVLERLDRAQAWRSMTAEKLAEAQTFLSTIPHTRQRIEFLVYLANLVGTKDRKAALKLLDQASEIVDTMKAGKEQTAGEIGLAMMYCLEKSDRGLDKMQALMPKLNELVAAAVKLDGYDSHNLRDGEWNMSNQGTVGGLLTMLSQNASYFAWCDFDRAVNVAGQFERSEIRLMAQMKLAQAILAGPPIRLVSTQRWE